MTSMCPASWWGVRAIARRRKAVSMTLSDFGCIDTVVLQCDVGVCVAGYCKVGSHGIAGQRKVRAK
eukprot:1257369-Pyramimonas_sp.AAC.1